MKLIPCRPDIDLNPSVLTTMQKVGLKCFDCCAGEREEVRKCPVETCPLFSIRLSGLRASYKLTNPEASARRSPKTPEQRAKMGAALARWRETTL